MVLPSQYKSIGIALVENQTVKPGLDDLLTNQLINDFTNDRSLKIEQLNRADLILESRITNYERSPQSYNANQEVSIYKISMNIYVRIRDKTITEEANLYNGDISSWITYDAQTEDEEVGVSKMITKLAQEVVRKTLTAW